MKKIINGKLYNTNTAQEIGHADNGCFDDDIDYVWEALYRKKTGEFFLYGIGGARSGYAESIGSGSTSGGRQIIPLSYDSAREWAEQHLTAEGYAAAFSISEDEETVTMCISMKAAEADIIRRNAAKEGMTTSAYIVHMCAE